MPAHKLSRKEFMQRLWSRIDKGVDSGFCWIWKGSYYTNGYGRICAPGRISMSAHKFMFEMCFGPVPKGLNVLHECDNPACCNPNHLFLGTQLVNMRDMVDKGRSLKGSRNGNTTSTDLDIIKIRELGSKGMSHRKLAKIFKKSKTQVGRILRKESWNHIEE